MPQYLSWQSVQPMCGGCVLAGAAQGFGLTCGSLLCVTPPPHKL